jgi:hypothetical protein
VIRHPVAPASAGARGGTDTAGSRARLNVEQARARSPDGAITPLCEHVQPDSAPALGVLLVATSAERRTLKADR